MKNEISNFSFTAICLITLSLATVGCASLNKSVGLGGAIGAGTGAILGGIADPGKDGKYRTKNVIIGAGLGGMAGMIAGSAIHKGVENQKREAFLKGRASAPQAKQGAMPSLKNPKVEARWIEGRIIGNRYVDGHFEYVIVEPARWEEN